MRRNAGIVGYPPRDVVTDRVPLRRLARDGASVGERLGWTSGGWRPLTPGAQTVTLNAASALSGHRVVIVDETGQARYPDRTQIAHADAVIGVTLHAASAGDAVTVQTAGDVTEGSWSWTPGPVWVGDAGLLTQSPPVSGWLQLFAVALTGQRIVLAQRQTVLLG